MIFLLVSVDAPEQEYSFESSSSIIIGRNSSCDIVISYKFISRIHCTLVLMCEDELFHYLLFDGEILGKKSTFGTWVNKELLIGKYRINNRDKITFHRDMDFPYLIALSDDETSEKDTLSNE